MKAKLLLVLVLVLMVSTLSLEAAYTIQRSALFTARAAVTGPTNKAVEAIVYNRLTDAQESMVTWTNINLPLPTGTTWKIGNHYVKLNFTNYYAPWGISLGSDNANPSAVPLYTGDITKAGGLVGTNTTDVALPLTWQVQQLKTDYQPPIISDPLEDPPGSSIYRFTNIGWTWKYMIDQGAPNFTDTANNGGSIGTSSVNYYAVPLYNGFRLWGGATNERAISDSPVYLYFAADFKGANVQVYKTTMLTLEMYKP